MVRCDWGTGDGNGTDPHPKQSFRQQSWPVGFKWSESFAFVEVKKGDNGMWRRTKSAVKGEKVDGLMKDGQKKSGGLIEVRPASVLDLLPN